MQLTGKGQKVVKTTDGEKSAGPAAHAVSKRVPSLSKGIDPVTEF